jgi:hypothetical protein
MARVFVQMAGALLAPALMLAGCGGGGGGGAAPANGAGASSASTAAAAGNAPAPAASVGVPADAGAPPVAVLPGGAGGSPAPGATPAVPQGAVQLAGGGWVTATAGESSIVVQRYDASGAAVGSAVDAGTSGARVGQVRVIALADGGFAVTWMAQDGSFATGYGYDLPLVYVQARHFDALGQALGAPVRVSATASYSYTTAVPTALAGGGYVILWSVDTSYPNIPGYRTPATNMRRMASNGAPMTAEAFVFDTYGAPVFSVTPAADGGFTIDWQRMTPGGTTPFTRAYDPQGNPTGPAQAGATTPPG